MKAPWHFFDFFEDNDEPAKSIYSWGMTFLDSPTKESPILVGVDENYELVELDIPDAKPYFVFDLDVWDMEFQFLSDGMQYAFLVDSMFYGGSAFIKRNRITQNSFCSLNIRDQEKIKSLIEEIGQLL